MTFFRFCQACVPVLDCCDITDWHAEFAVLQNYQCLELEVMDQNGEVRFVPPTQTDTSVCERIAEVFVEDFCFPALPELKPHLMLIRHHILGSSHNFLKQNFLLNTQVQPTNIRGGGKKMQFFIHEGRVHSQRGKSFLVCIVTYFLQGERSIFDSLDQSIVSFVGMKRDSLFKTTQSKAQKHSRILQQISIFCHQYSMDNVYEFNDIICGSIIFIYCCGGSLVEDLCRSSRFFLAGVLLPLFCSLFLPISVVSAPAQTATLVQDTPTKEQCKVQTQPTSSSHQISQFHSDATPYDNNHSRCHIGSNSRMITLVQFNLSIGEKYYIASGQLSGTLLCSFMFLLMSFSAFYLMIHHKLVFLVSTNCTLFFDLTSPRCPWCLFESIPCVFWGLTYQVLLTCQSYECQNKTLQQ